MGITSPFKDQSLSITKRLLPWTLYALLPILLLRLYFYPLPFPTSPETELPNSTPITIISHSSLSASAPSSPEKEKTYETPCDYFDGKWIRDKRGPLYNGTTCGTIKEGQNCIAHGRPDSGYLYWRWKPSQCRLPRFEPQTFLQLISNKHIAFVGDSMARNQLESLLCMLSSASTPNLVYRNGEDNKFRKWHFPSHNVSVSLYWSPFLVQGVEKSNSGPNHNKLYLDHVDERWARDMDQMDLIVLSIGHWFLHPAVYYDGSSVLGCHYCPGLNHTEIGATIREILQSEVINGTREVNCEELLSSLNKYDAESELLLHFLISVKEQKHVDAHKLAEEIRCMESDIEEVERRHDLRLSLSPTSLENNSSCRIENVSLLKESKSAEILPPVYTISKANELRLMKNMCLLENAYFSKRSTIKLPGTETAIRPDKDVLRNSDNLCVAQKDMEKHTDTLGAFFDGLCKYARYHDFEVRGILRTADFKNPVNVICSLSFDRDGEYFAAAGISKKIKIFQFDAIFNNSVDIHYPVVEMVNRSRLSCVCWNSYVQNYLASTDYDGVVQLWDANTGQGFSRFTEHEKRAWSVDFSLVCPTKFASGSDDCSLKLWSINEKNSLGTIRNVANVCCVQFSAHSSHMLAFGSADNSVYCYDLRFLRTPWCVLGGHRKSVSFVKFLDAETLVSASTDNTLKIWDLNKTSPVGRSTSACSLTLTGHTNEKNFVGLSVADGYITCGSETNEVYAYYKSFPMPVISHKFGSIDPVSGKEIDDNNGQFVSSVCWRGKSDMLIAANTSGSIKVLQMI